MLVTELPILPRSRHPIGCKLLLRSLPDGVTARWGIVPSHRGVQFVLHCAAKHLHAVCEIADLDYPTLRAMLKSIGYPDIRVDVKRATHDVVGHA